jgi:PAS domain S-box-containing protein
MTILQSKVSIGSTESEDAMAKTRILVVEDDGANARLIEMMLQSLGYAVPAVISSGEEAIKKAAELHPDLVLMDIYLKGDMDGVQAAEEIYTCFNIPVVYLTAYADNNTLKRAKITEPYGYILKPFEKRELHTTIDTALYKHNMDSKLKERDQALEKRNAELKTNNEQLQREITKRKRMQGALKESEAHYRELAESISDVFFAFDTDLRYTYWNKASEKLTGIPAKDALGKHLYDIFPDSEQTRSAEKAYRKAIRTRHPQHFTNQYQLDGKDFVFEISAYPSKSGLSVFAKDVTERQRIEQRWWDSMSNFYKVIDNIADGIIITDSEGKVLFANPAAESLFGRKRENFQGEQFGFLIISGDKTEVDIVRKPGEIVVAEMQVVDTVWYDQTACLASLRDITERKQAQRIQERLTQQLQAKVSELETLSYAIAHDLRSPLVSIQGFVSMLQADMQNQKTERVHEDIRIIESAVKKMGQIIKASLEYSRAGQLVKPSVNVSFGKVVEEVITEFAEQLSSIGATVSPAETFPRVCVDRMRIREVLTNLLQNSINYRDKTRPLKIEIGYRTSGNEVVLFMHDNGTGIDANETEKVFDLFYRGTADGEGSGAGLAIVKRIIEAHGGRIWAESQPGKGTTMYFALPQQNCEKMGDDNGED